MAPAGNSSWGFAALNTAGETRNGCMNRAGCEAAALIALVGRPSDHVCCTEVMLPSVLACNCAMQAACGPPAC